MRAESRIRLLNFISSSPLDCPVAVVFGHANAMNWAGPAYNDVGMEAVNKLWSQGFPTDLIPSSEITNKSLYIDKEGWICYGPQRYKAVVLYHPEFEKSSTADFFDKAQNSPTKLFRVGNWTQDFNGKAINGNEELLSNVIVSPDVESVVSEIIANFKFQNIAKQTPATFQLVGFVPQSASPPTTGFCHLIDGTYIQVAGTDNAAGDSIQATFKIGNYSVTFDAIGLAAVRLNKKGQVIALAGGGLKHFKAGDFEIKLDKQPDIALWTDNQGDWQGVIQGLHGPIPDQLLAITKNWVRLNVPVPL
jgi:hypothetical protein